MNTETMVEFFNDYAEQAFDDMKQRVKDLEFVFGPDSSEYLKAKETFAHVEGFIENNPGCTLHYEGELSIGISTAWIYCAAIWFANRDEKYEVFEKAKPGEWSLHS